MTAKTDRQGPVIDSWMIPHIKDMRLEVSPDRAAHPPLGVEVPIVGGGMADVSRLALDSFKRLISMRIVARDGRPSLPVRLWALLRGVDAPVHPDLLLEEDLIARMGYHRK